MNYPTAGIIPKLIALLALLAAIGAAALLLPAGGNPPPAAAQTIGQTDYDRNDNGLIDISSIAQLNAIRHDLNGNGDANHADYAAAFPNRVTATTSRTGLMGCPASGCNGYELTQSLTFPASGLHSTWTPAGRLRTTFHGNGYTISDLRIEQSGGDNIHVGLFREMGNGGYIRDLGLINPAVTSTTGQTNLGNTGALVGRIDTGGRIDTSYVQGGRIHADGDTAHVGGLAGYSRGVIRASYSTAALDPGQYVSTIIIPRRVSACV